MQHHTRPSASIVLREYMHWTECDAALYETGQGAPIYESDFSSWKKGGFVYKCMHHNAGEYGTCYYIPPRVEKNNRKDRGLCKLRQDGFIQ